MDGVINFGLLQIFDGLEFICIKTFPTVQKAVDEADKLWKQDHKKTYIVWNSAFEKVYQR